MTPSSSVKMSTSRFNMVCGKTVEQAVRPNLDRIPNPQAPKVLDSRVLTPSLTRRGLEREPCGAADSQQDRPPAPAHRPGRGPQGGGQGAVQGEAHSWVRGAGEEAPSPRARGGA